MKHEAKGKLNGKRSLFLLLFCSALVVMAPREAAAHIPKVVHAEENETSIDGELYEDSEILSCRTPVRYYYYKVLDEGLTDKKQQHECAEKWAAEALPGPDMIRGLIKKVKVANDEVTKEIQQRFCEMLKDGREDAVAAYAEALSLNGDLKEFDAVIACYKKCLNSSKWKTLGEREPRKRRHAFKTIRELVGRPDEGSFKKEWWGRGDPITIGADMYFFSDSQIWGLGELQQKIDEVYYGLIDLKKAKIAADNQRMDASSPNAPDLRKMRTMAAQTKKNVRVTKRMAKKAENAADAAAASADSAAASASSAAGSAASAADSAARAARSADAARFGF